MAISPDNTRIVTGSYDTTAIIWDFQTGEILYQLINHTDFVLFVAISNDNTKVVTTSVDLLALIWDL